MFFSNVVEPLQIMTVNQKLKMDCIASPLVDPAKLSRVQHHVLRRGGSHLRKDPHHKGNGCICMDRHPALRQDSYPLGESRDCYRGSQQTFPITGGPVWHVHKQLIASDGERCGSDNVTGGGNILACLLFGCLSCSLGRLLARLSLFPSSAPRAPAV